MGKNIIILSGTLSMITEANGEQVSFDSIVMSGILGGIFHQASIRIDEDTGQIKYSFSFNSGEEITYFSADRLSFKIKCRLKNTSSYEYEYNDGDYVKLESDIVVPIDFLQSTISRDITFILPSSDEMNTDENSGCLNPLSLNYVPCAIFQPSNQLGCDSETYPIIENENDFSILPTFSLNINSFYTRKDISDGDGIQGTGLELPSDVDEFKIRSPLGGTIEHTPIYTYPGDYLEITIGNLNTLELEDGELLSFEIDKVILDRKELYSYEYQSHPAILRGSESGDIQCFWSDEFDPYNCVLTENSIEVPLRPQDAHDELILNIPWRDIVTRTFCLKNIQLFNQSTGIVRTIDGEENHCHTLFPDEWNRLNTGRTYQSDIDFYQGVNYPSIFSTAREDDLPDGERYRCVDGTFGWRNNNADTTVQDEYYLYGLKPVRTRDEYLNRKWCFVDGDEWPVGHTDPTDDDSDDIEVGNCECTGTGENCVGPDFPGSQDCNDTQCGSSPQLYSYSTDAHG